jgi:hypothetical protein
LHIHSPSSQRINFSFASVYGGAFLQILFELRLNCFFLGQREVRALPILNSLVVVLSVVDLWDVVLFLVFLCVCM